MRAQLTGLTDAVFLTTDTMSDERGGFSRLYCEREFAGLNLPTRFVQSSLCRNFHAGTLRGMHFQRSPSQEGKLIRCLQGKIWDVIIDLRQSSPSYCRHYAVTLDGDTLDAVWAPPGFAHGYVTLSEASLVEYHMTDFYRPELAGGVRWDDPFFAIEWPVRPSQINERDARFPDFDPDGPDCLAQE